MRISFISWVFLQNSGQFGNGSVNDQVQAAAERGKLKLNGRKKNPDVDIWRDEPEQE